MTTLVAVVTTFVTVFVTPPLSPPPVPVDLGTGRTFLTVLSTLPTAEVALPVAPWIVFRAVGTGPWPPHPDAQLRGFGIGPAWLVPGSRETGSAVRSEMRLAWVVLACVVGRRPPAPAAPEARRVAAAVVADSARETRVPAGALTRGTETSTGAD